MNNKLNEDEKVAMKTMVSCLNMLMDQGFETQFKAIRNGLKSLSSDRIYMPAEVKVLNFYRFEGESDPSDNSIVYAIETITGERGTLTDAYGPYSDTQVTNFMRGVDEIHKKTDKEKTLGENNEVEKKTHS